jgi:hypothetical protein
MAPKIEPAPIRLSMNITPETDQILRATALRKGISVTEANRRAVAIMAKIDEEIDAGSRIEAIDVDGRISRFVFL